MYYSSIATVASVLLGMWAALVPIREIGPIDKEIDFLNSGWHCTVELPTVEHYNRRYAKYGVHLDVSTVPDTPIGRIAGPDWAHGVTLERLTALKSKKTGDTYRLVIATAIAGVGAVILFALGL